MIITPEIAGALASAVGILGLILRKARGFLRRVGNSWDGGIGFCDGSIVPPPKATLRLNHSCAFPLNLRSPGTASSSDSQNTSRSPLR